MINDEAFENIIHSIVANVCVELMSYFKDQDCFEVVKQFSQSRTFKNLYDKKTELWKEGPDYILEEYLREINYSYVQE